jgi:hypothetical protein
LSGEEGATGKQNDFVESRLRQRDPLESILAESHRFEINTTSSLLTWRRATNTTFGFPSLLKSSEKSLNLRRQNTLSEDLTKSSRAASVWIIGMGTIPV